jgi:VRR-NUC domain
MTNERDIQTRIRNTLGKCEDLALWRNNTGRWLDPNGRVVTFGLAVGSADLVGILAPSGRFIALEVKQPKGKAKPHQDQWLTIVRNLGGFAAVVTSEEEALRAIERARQGESQ